MQTEPRSYIVKNGESLNSIAAKNRVSWQSIYNAKCNNFLRLSRPDPNKIKAGDRIYIPPKTSDLARFRIEKLKKIKEDNDEMFKSILNDWERQYQKVSRTSERIDTAADIILMFKNLSGLCFEGHKIMKLEAEELAKATNAFVRSFVTDKLQSLSELTLKATNFTDVKGDEGTTLLFTKALVQSWFDMTTPSYWAKRFTGLDIESLNRNTRNQIIKQHDEISRQLDERISEVQKELDLALRVEKNIR